MSNRAAWITEAKGKPFQVDSAPLPKPGPNEVVIKNAAVAINPVDWKIQDFGLFLQKYPNILGTDSAGQVHQVGENVTHVKEGDRALGHCLSLTTNDPATGAFQSYTLFPSLAVSKIPDTLPYTSAAVLPLSLSTASACLYSPSTLALPFPTVPANPAGNGKSILVWGGSSSVGCSAIQLAVASGVTVVSVSSKHNIEGVEALGAKAVFDHNDPNVAQSIISALQGTQFLGVCDCIGTPPAAAAWSPVYKKLGGRFGSVMPDPQGLPEGIQGSAVYAPMVFKQDKAVGEAVWGKFVLEGLEAGVLRASPEPIILEGGLEKVQEGLDRLKEGVSFGKVVVAL